MKMIEIEFDGHKFYRLLGEMGQFDEEEGADIKNGGYYIAGKSEKMFADVMVGMLKLHPEWNFADVGANWGIYSSLVAKRTEGQVWSFEPQPDNFKVLKKNAELFENMKCFQKGLGADNRIEKLYTRIGHGGYSMFFGPQKEYVEIEIIPLDSLKLDINMMKMDVEGYGNYVLQGAKQTLENLSLLLYEIHRFEDPSLDFLQDKEFRIFPIVRKTEGIDYIDGILAFDPKLEGEMRGIFRQMGVKSR